MKETDSGGPVQREMCHWLEAHRTGPDDTTPEPVREKASAQAYPSARVTGHSSERSRWNRA